MNPNLYVNEKICLSMINTWSGPGWLPSIAARSSNTGISNARYPLQMNLDI